MDEPDGTSPTGRSLYYARSLKTHPRHDADCPFCAAGDKATPMQSVVEIDFAGVELRALVWILEDAGKLTAEIVKALKDADPNATATVVLDSYPFYAPKPGDEFRMLDTPTTAGRFGEHHLTRIRDGHLRALAAQQLGFDPLPKPAVKRKNEPKGKRGRAQWWNK